MYLTGVIEYILGDVIEIASFAARDQKRQTIKPRHIMLAIRNDDELSSLLCDVIVPGAGVLPDFYSLLPQQGKKKLSQL